MPDNIPDLVRRSDLFEIFFRQDDVQRLDGVVQAPRVRDADDGRGDDRVAQRPRDGHLGHGHSQSFGHALHGLVDGHFGRFTGSLLVAPGGDPSLLRVGSGEESTGLETHNLGVSAGSVRTSVMCTNSRSGSKVDWTRPSF